MPQLVEIGDEQSAALLGGLRELLGLDLAASEIALTCGSLPMDNREIAL